jgi:hypothetical protein
MIEPKRPTGSDPEAIYCQWLHDEIKRLRPMAVAGLRMGKTTRGDFLIEHPVEDKRQIKSSLIWDSTLPFTATPGVSGATFSRADKFGTTIAAFPYGNAVDTFHPDKGRWTKNSTVTFTVPQASTDGTKHFYGWDINPDHGTDTPGPGTSIASFGLQPDSGQTFTAAKTYVGSNPVFTFSPDPDHYAMTNGAFDIVARYKQRYVRVTGWAVGGLTATLEAGHFGDDGTGTVWNHGPGFAGGDFSVAVNHFTGPLAIYDWCVEGPLGFFLGKIGGSDVLGTYVDPSHVNPDLTVYAGGFDD